ncbi:hypothetical protein CRYUN_Cryun37aG0133100 [Craigia yunnanensis]
MRTQNTPKRAKHKVLYILKVLWFGECIKLTRNGGSSDSHSVSLIPLNPNPSSRSFPSLSLPLSLPVLLLNPKISSHAKFHSLTCKAPEHLHLCLLSISQMLTTISRMKSLIFPTFSPLSLHFPKTTSFAFFSLASKKLNICNLSTLSNPKFLHIKPTMPSPTPPIFSIPSRKLHTQTSQSSSPCGEIHVIVGPMFSGKTTTLLRRIQAESNNGRTVDVIKSNKDTRYGLDSIVTHDGMKLPCWALADLSSFRPKIGPDAYDQLDVIGIDEAQFFEDLYDFCCEAADHDGKTVIVAGLDGDYLRRSFGSVLDIIPLADSVMKLTARCELCGKRAFFTLRKTDETQTELIGGADVYMPVCRQHYVNGQVAIEAARSVLESQKLQCGSYT